MKHGSSVAKINKFREFLQEDLRVIDEAKGKDPDLHMGSAGLATTRMLQLIDLLEEIVT